MEMGFKRALDRIKKKIRRKKALLLASIIFLSVIMGMVIQQEDLRGGPSVEVFLDIQDICPTCRDQAYVSLDDQDYLTLYDGYPTKGRVVRRLFQLDLEFVESSLPTETIEQLVNGIQVADEEEYESVLSSFSDYAREKNE